MRWSKLKQLVEDRMADSLQRRVEVHSTRYYSGEGRGWITVDKREVANFSTLGFSRQTYHLAIDESGLSFWDLLDRNEYYSARHKAETTLRMQGMY